MSTNYSSLEINTTTGEVRTVEKPQIKNKFEIGQTVFVVDCGLCYTTYQNMAIKLNAKNYDGSKLSNGIPVMVLNFAIHENYTDIMLYLVTDSNGIEYLISEKGLSLEKPAPPEIKMERQVFKVGDKVLIVNSDYVYRSHARIAMDLKIKNYTVGASGRNSVGAIKQIKQHNDTKSSWIYIVELNINGTLTEIMATKNALVNINSFKNYPYKIGQKVRIKELVSTEKLYNNPGIGSGMRSLVGREFQIADMDIPLCYQLNTDIPHTWHHSWLEPVGSILKINKPNSIKWKKTNTLEELILNQQRNAGRVYADKTYPLIKDVYKSNYSQAQTIKLSKGLIKDLNNVYTTFMDNYGYSIEGGMYCALPICFLLGKNKDGIVCKAISFNKDKYSRKIDGCGQMTYICAEEIAKNTQDMIKLGYDPCGIARVGSFDCNNNKERGSSLSNISTFGNQFFILSLGRTGLKIESTRKYDVIVDSYEIVKLKKSSYSLDLK